MRKIYEFSKIYSYVIDLFKFGEFYKFVHISKSLVAKSTTTTNPNSGSGLMVVADFTASDFEIYPNYQNWQNFLTKFTTESHILLHFRRIYASTTAMNPDPGDSLPALLHRRSLPRRDEPSRRRHRGRAQSR